MPRDDKPVSMQRQKRCRLVYFVHALASTCMYMYVR